MGSGRFTSIHWMALAALAGSGCTKDATETNGAGMPGGGDEPLVSGPLCAECGHAGGESSDFEGDLPACAEFRIQRRISNDEATALGFDIVEATERAEREFFAPMRWTPTEPLSALTPGLPASGFSMETNVRGAVRPTGTLLHAILDPEVCDDAGNCEDESCASYAESLPTILELELDIETADGAIEATKLGGGMALMRSPLPEVVLVSFSADLSDVSGTLRIDANRPGPHLGRLEAQLALRQDGVRGTLSPVIVPDEPGASSIDDVPRDIPYQPSWQYRPITAVWPPDGCSIETLPVDDETTKGRAALERLATDYPAARAFVNMASPMAANWDDVRVPGRGGGAAQLSIELVGDPDFRCVEADGSTTFDTDVHVWTADGRLDWTTRMNGSFFTRPEEPPGLSIRTTQRFDAGAEFWSSKLVDIDLLGAQSAELRFYSSFGLSEDNAYVDGAISAELVPERSLDFRCANPNDTGTFENCGTPLEVDYLYWSFFR